MATLLDTHAVLWALTDPAALSPPAHRLITDPAEEIVVSAASTWELATKHRLGRLPEADALLAGHASHLARLGARPLDITLEHALLAGGMAWRHRDPFDRMLAAQCLVEGLALITKDPTFGEVGGLPLIW
ncbi:MAG: type II toxin-antitoxin system VapC family toxin [Dermatophilaceae bacterium]